MILEEGINMDKPAEDTVGHEKFVIKGAGFTVKLTRKIGTKMNTLKYSMMILFVGGVAFSQEQSKYTTPKPFDFPGISLTPPAAIGVTNNTQPARQTPNPVGPLWPIPLKSKAQNPGKANPGGNRATSKPMVGTSGGVVVKMNAQFGIALVSLGSDAVEVGSWCEVRRNGKLIGRILVRRVGPNSSICLMRRHEMVSPLQAGDQVMTLHKRTAKRR